MHYVSQNPGGAAANLTVASSVYGYIGTAPTWRRPSRLVWRQGPCHLVEDVLNAQAVQWIYRIGPHYVGSLQAAELPGFLARIISSIWSKCKRFEFARFCDRIVGAVVFVGRRGSHCFRPERVGRQRAHFGQDSQSVPQDGQQGDRQADRNVVARERHSDPNPSQRRWPPFRTGQDTGRSRYRIPWSSNLLPETSVHYDTVGWRLHCPAW